MSATKGTLFHKRKEGEQVSAETISLLPLCAVHAIKETLHLMPLGKTSHS